MKTKTVRTFPPPETAPGVFSTIAPCASRFTGYAFTSHTSTVTTVSSTAVRTACSGGASSVSVVKATRQDQKLKKRKRSRERKKDLFAWVPDCNRLPSPRTSLSEDEPTASKANLPGTMPPPEGRERSLCLLCSRAEFPLTTYCHKWSRSCLPQRGLYSAMMGE